VRAEDFNRNPLRWWSPLGELHDCAFYGRA
jgi:hypothetical protein